MPEPNDGLNIPSGETLQTQNSDVNYWRSFKELYNSPELVEESHHEFKQGVTDDFDPSELKGLSRRKFLALVGASAALAGAGCGYRDKGEIIPYNSKPEEITIGQPNYYASTINGLGVLVTTREGRPIKIDGNPDHPVSLGKIDARVQAEILNLYDPERLKSPLKGDTKGNFQSASWVDVNAEIINELSKAGGRQIALITNKIISPLTRKVISDFTSKYPSTVVYSYELTGEQTRNSAWTKTNGAGIFPLIKWNEAKVIVALESDFLGCGEDKVETARLYSQGRDINNVNGFNRLYVVEGNLSVTGINADYRLRLRPDAIYEFVTALLNEVSRRGVGNTAGGNVSLSSVAGKFNLNTRKLNLLVDDLIKNRGRAIVHAGSSMPENVHAAVNLLNDILGNSALYRTDTAPVEVMPLSTISDLGNLVSQMNAGGVAAVIHLDSNPVYTLPKDLGYSNALAKAGTVITLTDLHNETSELSHYVLPVNHPLESWGDAKTRTGFISVQQPVITPLLNSRQKEAVLNTWTLGKPEGYYGSMMHDYMMQYFETYVYPSSGSSLPFNQFWNGALHDGVVLVSESAAVPSSANTSIPLTGAVNIDNNKYALVLKESYSLGDGKYANNGWLQELPHPVSKVVWDNYAAISPATAKELGVDYNDFIEINAGGRTLKIPAFIQPGSADKTITIELGYGRTKTGTVGTEVGFNANLLMSKNGGLSPLVFTGVAVKKSEGSYKLATTQEHHIFDKELTKDIAKRRGIIKEGTVSQYKKDPAFLKEGKGEELKTFYPEYQYNGLKWGMVIDQNKCLGCAECIVACIAENNIPVVGKEQVANGREMHWLRVDRYYSGGPENPEVHTQVMLCQHCDHAPCENVCPVVATTHSPDGLNQMIYNRCVGTRYCSNNCPYKVRRFNYFNFRAHFNDGFQESSLLSLIYNPEVTVRSRGVMEKCTFCIQRIMHEKQSAAKENRPAKGANVTTACQDACATGAITFGDVNDRESEVAKLSEHNLGYLVLDEVNTRPNVTYLARLRNTHSNEPLSKEGTI